MASPIENMHSLRLTISGSEALFDALENPPQANQELLKAAQLYKETVSANKARETP